MNGPGPLLKYTVLEASVYCNQPIVAGVLLENANTATTTTARRVLEARATNERCESDEALIVIKMLLRRIPTKEGIIEDIAREPGFETGS